MGLSGGMRLSLARKNTVPGCLKFGLELLSEELQNILEKMKLKTNCVDKTVASTKFCIFCGIPL